MSKHLTYEIARDLADEIIAKYGKDHVYDNGRGGLGSCYYTELYGGQLCPSCFVGILLTLFGVSLTDLEYIDKNRANSAKCVLTHMVTFLGITVEEKAGSFLLRFQELQDEQTPWGECLTIAAMTAEMNPMYISMRHGDSCPHYLGDTVDD